VARVRASTHLTSLEYRLVSLPYEPRCAGHPMVLFSADILSAGDHKMKKLLVAGIALTVAMNSAQAADMPVKVPVAVAPIWTGLYLGVHAGGAWGSNVSQAMVDANGGGFDDPNFGATTKFGALGGAQIGYNWQLSPSWVVGVEGDFSWTSLNNASFRAPAIAGGAPIPTTSVSMSNNVRWLASARGRVGYAVDKTLFYVTGGPAWMNVSYSSALNVAAPWVASTSFTKTHTGLVLGPGVEWLLNPNWAVRAEYLYYAFPSAGASTAFLPLPCHGCSGPVNFSWSKGNVQVVRLGLDYKF
jgi:outer membrane immunogenic protein